MASVEDVYEIKNTIQYYNTNKHISNIDKRLLLGAFYREFTEDMMEDLKDKTHIDKEKVT